MTLGFIGRSGRNGLPDRDHVLRCAASHCTLASYFARVPGKAASTVQRIESLRQMINAIGRFQ
jgi:hypothetical protein